MDPLLFEEFEEVSAKKWKQKIQYDLKGANYNEKLVYQSPEGIHVKPFYHPDHDVVTHHIPSPKKWDIVEQIYVASVEKSNEHAKNTLEKGAESLWFIIPSQEVAISKLLKGISLETTPISISFEFLSEEYVSNIHSFLKEKKHKVSLSLDIIGNLASSGNWFENLKKDHTSLENIISKNAVFESVLSIHSGLYQNSGATITQELAYSLSHANEYLNHFGEQLSNQKIRFIVSIGSNYFFEIAKLRALRLLYATLASEYGLPENCTILAVPSKRDKTLYDYNLNLLRTTTQSMSAILGGANSVYNLPYDAIYHKSNEFGDRIARNQLLILKNESYFNKVSNAAEGNYYVESLTQQLAEKALEIFKEIECGGGFLTQLKEGVIQRKIAESAEKEEQLFQEGKLVLIGTNKWQNPEDKMKGELELYPFLKKNPRKTLLQPILEKRLAERIEQHRLEEEKNQETSA